ncbi:MAG: site-specific DNA-methyltransferase [Candidatus Staskawiczbacteria bacterium]|nr:site-specific DNA-methyltransferase [Candidatus Staskawiczbacteria bacterium]
MIVAESLGRIPYGVEFDVKRVRYIKSKIKNKSNIINGSSLKLKSYKLPKFNFVFTSTPYMAKDEKENPFSSYTSKGSYVKYLKDLYKIFFQLKKVMKKDAYLVIEVSNLKGKEVTTLAWDTAREASKVFSFEGEVLLGWKGKDSYRSGGDYGYGYDHSYCLIFKNK